MPNWCTGTLKVRGKQQNVERFLTESMPQFHCPLNIDEPETALIHKSNSDICNGYIVGSKRSFVESDIAYLFSSNNDIIILMFERVDCAWSFDVDEFAELSKKFQVDFFFYGFEQGCAFNQKVEIHNGIVIKNEIINFDDYQWECIYPHLGSLPQSKRTESRHPVYIICPPKHRLRHLENIKHPKSEIFSHLKNPQSEVRFSHFGVPTFLTQLLKRFFI